MQQKSHIVEAALVVVLAVLAFFGVPCHAQTPSTSKDICQTHINDAEFPTKIRPGQTADIRDVTGADLATLKDVMRSQCMLTANEMKTYWDGKTEAQREAFFANYARIKGLVSSSAFDKIFPPSVRNAAFTFDRFLRATAAFPYLCGESGESDDVCKREFATMFAHWSQETGRLKSMYEDNCSPGEGKSNCADYLSKTNYFYNDKAGVYDPVTGKVENLEYNYFGRGPKQLSWNSNYGRYSWGFYNDMRLVERPNLLVSDLDNIFVSALWFYMTPISQKPSMHQVVAGLWQPNSADTARNIVPGFGATTNIINGAIECGKGTVSDQAMNRIRFYNGGVAQKTIQTEGTLAYLGLPTTNEATDTTLYCKNMGLFPADGAGVYALYLNLNPWSQCELYTNENPFTIYDQTPFVLTGDPHVCADGYDCCKIARSKITETKPNIPLEIVSFGKWMRLEKSVRTIPSHLMLLLGD